MPLSTFGALASELDVISTDRFFGAQGVTVTATVFDGPSTDVAVIIALPSFTPVMTPSLTVATPSSLEVQLRVLSEALEGVKSLPETVTFSNSSTVTSSLLSTKSVKATYGVTLIS